MPVGVRHSPHREWPLWPLEYRRRNGSGDFVHEREHAIGVWHGCAGRLCQPFFRRRTPHRTFGSFGKRGRTRGYAKPCRPFYRPGQTPAVPSDGESALDGQSFSAFSPAGVDHFATVFGLHAGPETVGSLPRGVVGLIGSFHLDILWLVIPLFSREKIWRDFIGKELNER